jgi:hypothetical protein
MTDEPKLSGGTVLLLIQSAAILQVIVMVLLAVDRIKFSVAVPLLGLVLIFGLIPAGAFVKSKK